MKKIRHLPTKPPHTDTPKSVGIVSGAISSKPWRNVSFVSGNRRQTLLQVIHAQNSHFFGERENSLLNVNLTSQQHCTQQSQCTEAKKVKVSICHHHQCIFLRITHHSHTAWLLCPATFCHLTERREKKVFERFDTSIPISAKKTHQFELLWLSYNKGEMGAQGCCWGLSSDEH